MEIEDQPPPIPSERPAIVDLVIQDLMERKSLGIERYGTPLQTHNGRDAMIDLYQELQDATAYIRQVIEERRDHFAAAEALIADWLEWQANAEATKAQRIIGRKVAGLEVEHGPGGLIHGSRAGALREAAQAVRQGQARREGRA